MKYDCPLMVNCPVPHTDPPLGTSVLRHFDREHIDVNRGLVVIRCGECRQGIQHTELHGWRHVEPAAVRRLHKANPQLTPTQLNQRRTAMPLLPQPFRRKPSPVVHAMTFDGSQASAEAIVAWADPLTHGRCFTLPAKDGSHWLVLIEIVRSPGSLAVLPGDVLLLVDDTFTTRTGAAFDADYEAVTQ